MKSRGTRDAAFKPVLKRWAVCLMVVALSWAGMAAGHPALAIARDYSYQELQFLQLINNYREDSGVGPLLLSDMLSTAAVRHNSDMATYGFFGHNTVDSDYFPLGSTFDERMALCGYEYNTYMGENIAAGCATAQEVLNAWVASPIHEREILKATYKVIGISRVYRPESTYGYYWTTDFGGYIDPTAHDPEGDPVSTSTTVALPTTVTTTTTTTPTTTTTTTSTTTTVLMTTTTELSPTTTTNFTTPEFADVSVGAPYYEAVARLREAGIILGYWSEDHWDFRPDVAVKRAQFAKMICGVLGVAVSEDLKCAFTDVGPDSPADLYPDDYVAAAARDGIVLGSGNNLFNPWSAISRAQVVTMIVRGATEYRPNALKAPPVGYLSSVPATGEPLHDTNLLIAEWSGVLADLEQLDRTWDPWAAASRGEVAQMLWNVVR